ncbi:MAG TPA: hypothetical protein VGL28_02760 [Steroidobacteraceae bacterium]|jgi:hypothetical protein
MIAGNGLHVVGSMAVGAAYQQRVAGVAQNMNRIGPNIRGTADAAALRIETVNGTFVIEQRLRAYVECRIASSGPDANGGGCSVTLDLHSRWFWRIVGTGWLLPHRKTQPEADCTERRWTLSAAERLTSWPSKTRDSELTRSSSGRTCSEIIAAKLRDRAMSVFLMQLFSASIGTNYGKEGIGESRFDRLSL